MKRTDLAYVAGIIDGEGTIGIYPRYKQGKRNLELDIGVRSIDEWLCRFLQVGFGGCVYHTKAKLYQSECWDWKMSSRQAGEFLKIILPYLHLKRPQAEVAIKFQEAKKYWGHGVKDDNTRGLEEAQAILLKEMKTTNKRKMGKNRDEVY